MIRSYLKYPLVNGFIDHWLAAGPTILSKNALDDANQASQPYLSPDPGITGSPVDLGYVEGVSTAAAPLTWRYYRCREDHYVDFTSGSPQPGLQAAFCAVVLHCPSASEVTLALTASGQTDLWLDHQHLARLGNLEKSNPQTLTISTKLHQGENEIIIRVLAPSWMRAVNVVALLASGSDTGEMEAWIQTEIEPNNIKARLQLEELAEAAYLDRYVYGYLEGDQYNRNEPIRLRFSDRLKIAGELTCRLQSLSGDIFQEGARLFGASAEIEMARLVPLRSGPHHLVLLPDAEIYYVKKLRFERKLLFMVARSPYNVKALPLFKERVKSALQDASERRGDSLYSEIAKIAINRWDNLDQKVIQDALARIQRCDSGSAADLLGFLGILSRFGKKRTFPKGLKNAILNAASAYDYCTDGPGCQDLDGSIESRQILFYTCQILAGQLLPDIVFAKTEKPGRALRELGELKALEWMRNRGAFGFREWDSPNAIETVTAALTHLVDIADEDAVSELAAVLLDKVFFSLAVNSFNGAYASSRGGGETSAVLSARLEATSGITRLLWRMGTFNDAVMGTVSLACCRNYRLPKVIAEIAADRPAALWSREQHCQPFSPAETPPANPWRVNKVMYRTADYALSSAQDYLPGAKGHGEHIWQAAMGPDALVFTNHPTCMSEADAHPNNLWRGNGNLPRAAQWGDVLVAVYCLPDDDWMGFTHAYFPAAAFDETRFEDGWAFARKGSGYLALTAFRGFEFRTEGQTANRELRSDGKTNTWLCHMGQALLDGEFEFFIQKIKAMEMKLSDQSVELKSLRGDVLSFGWEGPFLVNGTAQPLDGYAHIENPYCTTSLPAEQLEILYRKNGIRLKFS